MAWDGAFCNCFFLSLFLFYLFLYRCLLMAFSFFSLSSSLSLFLTFFLYSSFLYFSFLSRSHFVSFCFFLSFSSSSFLTFSSLCLFLSFFQFLSVSLSVSLSVFLSFCLPSFLAVFYNSLSFTFSLSSPLIISELKGNQGEIMTEVGFSSSFQGWLKNLQKQFSFIILIKCGRSPKVGWAQNVKSEPSTKKSK